MSLARLKKIHKQKLKLEDKIDYIQIEMWDLIIQLDKQYKNDPNKAHVYTET